MVQPSGARLGLMGRQDMPAPPVRDGVRARAVAPGPPVGPRPDSGSAGAPAEGDGHIVQAAQQRGRTGVVQYGIRRAHQRVGQFLRPVRRRPLLVTDLGHEVGGPPEHDPVAGALDEVGGAGVHSTGPEGNEVGASPQFAQDSDDLEGPSRGVRHQEFTPEAGVEGQPDRVGRLVDGVGGGHHGVEPLDVGEGTAAHLGRTVEIGAGGLTGGDVLCAEVPQGVDHVGVEVAERAGHHDRFHVAEDATPADGIQREDVDPELGGQGLRLGGEVVGPADVPDDRAGAGHEFIGRHAGRLALRPRPFPVAAHGAPGPACVLASAPYASSSPVRVGPSARPPPPSWPGPATRSWPPPVTCTCSTTSTWPSASHSMSPTTPPWPRPSTRPARSTPWSTMPPRTARGRSRTFRSTRSSPSSPPTSSAPYGCSNPYYRHGASGAPASSSTSVPSRAGWPRRSTGPTRRRSTPSSRSPRPSTTNSPTSASGWSSWSPATRPPACCRAGTSGATRPTTSCGSSGSTRTCLLYTSDAADDLL